MCQAVSFSAGPSIFTKPAINVTSFGSTPKSYLQFRTCSNSSMADARPESGALDRRSHRYLLCSFSPTIRQACWTNSAPVCLRNFKMLHGTRAICALPCADFHEAHECPAELCAHMSCTELYPNRTKSAQNSGKMSSVASSAA